MFAIYKDFSLNVFYVFFIPTVVIVAARRLQVKRWNRQSVVVIVYSLSLVISMAVPVAINGLTYDFRAIALTAGSIYGGIPASLVLGIVLLAYRGISGYPNQLEYAVSLIPALLSVIWIIRNYPTYSMRRKAVSAAGASFLISLFTLIGYRMMAGDAGAIAMPDFSDMPAWIVFQSLTAGAYVYILERMLNHIRLQEDITKTEKLRLVSGIAISVAHEVRNPLTSVRGFVQLLGRGNISPGNRLYYQKLCLEELDKAQRIISDYLTLAKPEAEKKELFFLNNEIGYMVHALASYANPPNVDIRFETLADNPQIIGDIAKFRQALMNLCKNSLEAMPEGGTLRIETSSRGDRAMIAITDTGVGMTDEQVRRLGTPFYSTKEKGTGLGTMVSFAIIKNMEGEIRVASKPDKGTEVTITFPLPADKERDSAVSPPLG